MRPDRRLRIIIAFTALSVMTSALVAIEPAAHARPAATAEELIGRMIEAQKSLRQWSAKAAIHVRVGSFSLPVNTRVYCRRPDQIALRFIGITMRPTGGFLLPDPLLFAGSSQYDMQLAGVETSGGVSLYTLTAQPKAKTAEYSWRFIVDGGTWQIAGAQASKNGEQTELRVTYAVLPGNVHLPSVIRGSGILLLREALPPGLVNMVEGAAGKEGVSYTVTLSEYEVNDGVPANVFGKG